MLHFIKPQERKEMPTKTIIAIIAMLIITVSLIFTGADDTMIYFTIGIIGTLGGISIYKNGIHKS